MPCAPASLSAITAPGGHQPVLRHEVLEQLAPAAGKRYLDATFGGGGHTRALLEADPGVEVVALDRDPAAAPRAAELAERFVGRFTFLDANFRDLADLPGLGRAEFAGILFDLGVSSFHFDQGERGFSFRLPGPVDMRMDPRQGRSAAEFLETASREELVEAVRDYGEEPRWRVVVEALLAARGSGALARTDRLADLVARANGRGRGFRGHALHPATLVFQGLRLAVNEELPALQEGLPAAFTRLAAGGVLAVISFHSLEDRLVKRYFRRLAGLPEHAGDSAPQQSRQAVAELVRARPITADPAEVAENPRARSAKLRVLRKLPLS